MANVVIRKGQMFPGGGGSSSVDAFDVTYTPTGSTTQTDVGTVLDTLLPYTASTDIITDKFATVVDEIDDDDYILIETASGDLNKIRKADLITGGGGTPSRDVTWAQYQALTEEEKMSDTDWYVKDRTVPSSSGSKDVDITNILESYENRMTIVDYTTKKYGNMVFAVVFCEAVIALSSSQNTIFKTTNNVLSFDYCYGNNTSWNYSTKSINRNSLSIEAGEGYMFAFYTKLVEED